MRKKQNITKDEAIILLQSQPLDAHLWQLAGVDLKSNAIRFPDPSYLDSQSWPEYIQAKKKNGLKTSDLYRDRKTEIEVSTPVDSVELNENIETESFSSSLEKPFSENILVHEIEETIPIQIDETQLEDPITELIEQEKESISVKKTKLPLKRKTKKQKKKSQKMKIHLKTIQ